MLSESKKTVNRAKSMELAKTEAMPTTAPVRLAAARAGDSVSAAAFVTHESRAYSVLSLAVWAFFEADTNGAALLAAEAGLKALAFAAERVTTSTGAAYVETARVAVSVLLGEIEYAERRQAQADAALLR